MTANTLRMLGMKEEDARRVGYLVGLSANFVAFDSIGLLESLTDQPEVEFQGLIVTEDLPLQDNRPDIEKSLPYKAHEVLTPISSDGEFIKQFWVDITLSSSELPEEEVNTLTTAFREANRAASQLLSKMDEHQEVLEDCLLELQTANGILRRSNDFAVARNQHLRESVVV